MIYLRYIELVDEYDNTIYRARNIKALKGLAIAIRMVKEKGGIKQKLKELDEEFKEYFGLK